MNNYNQTLFKGKKFNRSLEAFNLCDHIKLKDISSTRKLWSMMEDWCADFGYDYPQSEHETQNADHFSGNAKPLKIFFDIRDGQL